MYVNIDFEGGRRLRCDISAIQEIETNTGKPLGQVLMDLRSMGIQTLIVALWACLKHDEASLNLNLVKKRIDKHLAAGKSLKPLFDALGKAIEGSGVFQGVDDEDEVQTARPQPAGTTTANPS